MGRTVLVTGGARSRKSAIAEARDEEMATRIAAHQARRDDNWRSHAEPLNLTGALAATDGQGPRLVDCLTFWLTNLMLGGHDWPAAGRALVAAPPAQTDPVVLVTNEVGAGIVPENVLAREFRDAAGILNQWVAAVADEVTLAVAGLPLGVK
jgi:adenosylcobinamide kinase/adenosylcobinamide-phosphate guanylyltransferase